MAWTNPKTWVAGIKLTAAELNAHVRDNLLALRDHVHGGETAGGGAVDHDDLVNVSIDQHHARDHQARHEPGGADASATLADHNARHEPGGADAMAADAADATASLRTLGLTGSSAAKGTVFADHNARHEPGGADPMAVDAAAATGSLRTLGTGAAQAAQGTHVHAPGTFSAEDATTSGTSRDITGIPAGVRRITIVLVDVSEASSLAQMALQIGDAGGIETSGYTSAFGHGVPGGSPAFQGQGTDTTYWQISGTPSGAELISGIWTLINENGNTWVIHGSGYGVGSATEFIAGRKTLSGTLDRIRLTTITGAGTFDAGVWRILYE